MNTSEINIAEELRSANTIDLSVERIDEAFFSPEKDKKVSDLLKDFITATHQGFNGVNHNLDLVTKQLNSIQENNEIWKKQVVEKVTDVEERIKSNEDQISQLNNLVQAFNQRLLKIELAPATAHPHANTNFINPEG